MGIGLLWASWLARADWASRADAISQIWCEQAGCPNLEPPPVRFQALDHAVRRHSDRARIPKKTLSDNVRPLS